MKPPGISESEWIKASVVWDREGLTVTEIVERLAGRTCWKLKTMNTFSARLVAKGVLVADCEGRAFRYSARSPREHCVRAKSESFLRRILGGAADLSDEEITGAKPRAETYEPQVAFRLSGGSFLAGKHPLGRCGGSLPGGNGGPGSCIRFN